MYFGRGVLSEKLLNHVPGDFVDDGLVFAGVGLVLVADLAEVGDVGQELVQRALAENPAATFAALACGPAFGPPAEAVEVFEHDAQRAVLEVQGEDRAHALCLV